MATSTKSVTQQDWVLCGRCTALVYGKRIARSLGVCPECGHHGRLGAAARLGSLADPGTAVPLAVRLPAEDPLGFRDLCPYPDRLAAAREHTGLAEAMLCARARVGGQQAVLAAMDFGFIGGSLGSGTGEIFLQAAHEALSRRLPLLVATASGGARMQEGVLSLMQMAATSQAMAELDEAGLLTVTLVTDPTFGGVAASFATLSDVILAEPGARMGFAGPRVIAQTTGGRLPGGFQTAEFLLSHGLVDDVQPRGRLRRTLAALFAVAQHERAATAAGMAGGSPAIRDPGAVNGRDPWQTIRIARGLDRPGALDYIRHLFEPFVELHGDRVSGECPALVGGLGLFRGMPAAVLGHQRGHTPAELRARNFGRARPEGYRKAARLMRLAAKLRIPVITLIDTPGAEPGVLAEERGQAHAIAENLRLMSTLPVPIVAAVIGEGGSGGALGLGVADEVYVCENAFYSVISPEGCAAILWRDAAAAPEAARRLQITAPDLLRLRVADGVVPEPPGGSQRDPAAAARALGDTIEVAVRRLSGCGTAALIQRRRGRFRRYQEVTG